MLLCSWLLPRPVIMVVLFDRSPLVPYDDPAALKAGTAADGPLAVAADAAATL